MAEHYYLKVRIQCFDFHDHPAVIQEILESGHCPMCLLKGEEIPVADYRSKFESEYLIQQCPKCSTFYICDDY